MTIKLAASLGMNARTSSSASPLDEAHAIKVNAIAPAMDDLRD
jgi:hypothetical protein